MSATDDVKTLGRSRLSFATQADLDEFVETLDAFENGRLTPDQWRGFRLVRGLYGQRQEDLHMIRVKVPQGILNGEQLDALAEVVERHSRGFGHITTRQNIQFHFVQLHDAEPAFERLAATGLTTREACGNSVRNITACQYAGTAADEVFDVTPYAEALTRYFLRHPLSASLPRKFKIAFEGCVEDHALHRHQRHRLARRRAAAWATGASWASASRWAEAPRRCRGLARRCSTSCRLAKCSMPQKRSCACSIASATTSTSTRTG